MSDDILHLDDGSFQSTISSGLVLVDYYADWCGPCRAIAPVLEQLAVENAGKVVIAKIDVDKAPDTTSSYGVSSIPTLILFKDGKEVKRFVGVTMKAQLQDAINKQS